MKPPLPTQPVSNPYAGAEPAPVADFMETPASLEVPENPPVVENARPGGRLESLPAGSLGWQIFALALPMLTEQFFTFMVGLVDTFLAGKISRDATATVGMASYMGWYATLIFMLVATGLTAVVSRSFGALDRGTARLALNQSLVLAMSLGLGASIVAEVLAPWTSHVLLQTEETRVLGTSYLRIDALGYVFLSLTTVGFAGMRAAGDTRTPMLVMIAVNVLNIVFASTLVSGWFFPSVGPLGIAVGTLTARLAGCVITLWVLRRGVRGLRIDAAMLRPQLEMLRRVLRIGLPAAADAFIMATAQMIFIWIIGHSAQGEAGTVNFAAHQIAMRVEAISYLPAFAWGTAAATVVGQYLGAGNPQRATRAGHLAALQGCTLTAVVGLCFFLFARAIFGLMTEDPAVREVGAPAFRILGFAQPFIGMAIIYTASLRGAGDTRFPMFTTVVCSMMVRVPVAYLGAIVLNGGLLGAWYGMWSDNVTRGLVGLGRFASGRWRRARV